MPTRRTPLAAALAASLATSAHAQATSPAEAARLEAALPSLAGRPRARALATLATALENERPREAVAYGREALRLFDAFPDPGARAETCAALAWAYMTMAQYDSAAAIGRRAERYAAEHARPAAQATALDVLGSLAQRQGDPDLAVAHFARALSIQRSLGAARDVAVSLNNLGFVYSTDLADYDRALAAHAEALAIRQRLGDSSAIALSLNNLGIVHGRLRRYDRALTYFRRALAIRRALGLRPRVAATLDNIGSLYHDLGEHARALDAHRESLAIRRALADPSAVAQAHRNVGVEYLALGQPARARAELAAAIRLGDSVGDKGLRVRNLVALSAVQVAAGQARAAEQSAARALEIARSMGGARDMRQRAWEALSGAQAAAGRHAAALASYRRVKVLGDSIFDAATGRRIAGLERRVEEGRRAHELEALRSEQQIYRLEARERTWERNAAIAVALLAAALGGALYRRRAERARMAELLSLTDPLTGAKNRRSVERLVEAETALAVRRHEVALRAGAAPGDADLVCLLLDLDHFKRVNDTYGHAAGDRLLVETARALEAASRRSDVVARWGGEEFLVVARGVGRRQAGAHADRLRAAIAGVEVRLADGRALRVTASVGYAVFPFDARRPDAVTWEQTVRLADHAVYAAKRGGRDRAVGLVAGDRPHDGGVPFPDDDAALERWLRAGRIARRESDALVSGSDALAPGSLVGAA